MASKAHVISNLGARELPRIVEGEPVLRIFVPPTVLYGLAEEAVIVADAVAHGGDLQRRHAVQEAGGRAKIRRKRAKIE